MKQLVFIHGRAQEHKDIDALKTEWIDAWCAGLAKSGLAIPIAEADIRFPYYGNTLYDLAQGKTLAEVASIIVKGADERDLEQREFIREVLLEVQEQRGITDAEVSKVLGSDTLDKGVLNWGWIQGILEVIDRHVPLASGISIALATRDVYQYIDNIAIRDEIETGVRKALMPGLPTVVVSHSLGTVVAYNLLRREGVAQGWTVPLFMTLGSPLAVSALRKKLSPNRHPPCVGWWFNAFDEHDVVALFPLDAKNFPVEPEITNKRDIYNPTTNRHGISGYLSDPVVAKTIYEALMN